jgi:hypothetical protein
MAEASDRLAD